MADGRRETAQAWRTIGGQRKWFRSRWEANIARFLEMRRMAGLFKAWEHEPETFWFEGIRRGVTSYKPDFRVTEHDGSLVRLEVKGYMDSRSRTCILRMAKYHPKVRIVLIGAKEYRAIAKAWAHRIPEWEHDPKPLRKTKPKSASAKPRTT